MAGFHSFVSNLSKALLYEVVRERSEKRAAESRLGATPAVHTATILTRGQYCHTAGRIAVTRDSSRTADIVKHHFWFAFVVFYSARLVGFAAYFIIFPLRISHREMIIF